MFFLYNATATTDIYTLSLHDALPISFKATHARRRDRTTTVMAELDEEISSFFTNLRLLLVRSMRTLILVATLDRKSTRLNSSHTVISYAVFCLKKKRNKIVKVYQQHN